MKNTTDISKVLKGIAAVTSVLVMIIALVACADGNKKQTVDKDKTTTSMVGELTSDEETSLTDKESSDSTSDTTKDESTTANTIESTADTTTEPTATTTVEPTTTKKQQITTTKATTTKKTETATSQQETTTRREVNTRPVETHPVTNDDWYEEATTTRDYSDEEPVEDDNILDIFEEVDIPIYEAQLKDEIRFRTSYIRNWLNYSISEYNTVYNAELTYLLMEYYETHNPDVFALILVDDLKAENWKRICAAEIYNRAKAFDWKCITEYHNIYNNLLWDCVYNDDFTNITNIKYLPIPEDQNERIFEDLDGAYAYYTLKISFSSNGSNYIAWFEGDRNLQIIDIDRID